MLSILWVCLFGAVHNIDFTSQITPFPCSLSLLKSKASDYLIVISFCAVHTTSFLSIILLVMKQCSNKQNQEHKLFQLFSLGRDQITDARRGVRRKRWKRIKGSWKGMRMALCLEMEVSNNGEEGTWLEMRRITFTKGLDAHSWLMSWPNDIHAI